MDSKARRIRRIAYTGKAMAKFMPRQIVAELDADFPTTQWEPGTFYIARVLHHSKVAVIHEMLQHLDLGTYQLRPTQEHQFVLAQMAVKAFVTGIQGDLQVVASLGKNPLATIREVLLAAAAETASNQVTKPSPPESGQPATPLPESRNRLEPHTRRRAVILTALPLEFKAVVARLRDLRKERHPNGTMYTTGTFGDGEDWTVSVAVVGAGNARAAQEAERAATHFKPETMFFVGVAGGRKDVKHGDVVASEKIYGYESGKATKKRFLPRPEVVNGSYGLVQLAFHASTTDDWTKLVSPRPAPAPSVFVKPMASGEKLVGSSESSVAKLLGETYGDALAVEMEGYGFLKAVHAMTGVSALVIRGVSDLLDDKPNADASGKQELAARNAEVDPVF